MRRIAIYSVLILLGGCQQQLPEIAVSEMHADSKVTVEVKDEGKVLHVHAITPSGIGGTRLTLRRGRWPGKLVVHLSYAPGKPFRALEGFGAELEARIDPWRALTGGGGGPTWTDGAVRIERDLYDDGTADVLYIHWVDAYRR